MTQHRRAVNLDTRGVADHPESWSSPLAQVEMRKLWTYSDGSLTVKGYRSPGFAAGAGSWVLVDQATGNVHGVVPPGEFSRRSGRWTCSPMYPVLRPTWGRLPRLTVPPWCTWSLTATPSCWLTGPAGRRGLMRSS